MLSDLRAALGRRVRSGTRRIRRVLGEDGAEESTGESEERERSDDHRELEAAADRLTYSSQTDADDVVTVIDALDREDPAARLIAARALANVPTASRAEAARAIPDLIDLLDDEPKIRRAAARALGRLADADREAVVADASRIAAYVDAYNVWISDGASAALGEAAAVAPEEVAPLVFEYVDHPRAATSRNAIEVIRRAAEVSPGTIEPVVPDLLDQLNREGTARHAIETLGVLAEKRPGLLIPAVSDVLAFAERTRDEPVDAVIRTLASLAVADPSATRECVPFLTEYLEEAPRQADRAAEALVAILREHPEERRTVMGVLDGTDSIGHLHVAHAIAIADEEVGLDIAHTILEDRNLEGYLEHFREEATGDDATEPV